MRIWGLDSKQKWEQVCSLFCRKRDSGGKQTKGRNLLNKYSSNYWGKKKEKKT